MTGNIFRQALTQRSFVVSFELTLGRDYSTPEVQQFIDQAANDPNGIKVLSVTDLAGGHPALPPEFIMGAIQDRGLTPVAHLSGKDGNRNFLEGRLHGFARLDVQNILALTGDAPSDGFGGRARPACDLDSVLILQLITALREGLAQKGFDDARSGYDFFPGAVVNPYKVREADQMMQFYKLHLKIATGARFIIPQLGFNLRKLYELKQYLTREGYGHIPILPSVYAPTFTIGKIMHSGGIPGCLLPDSLLARLSGEKKPQRIERAALMVAAIRSLGFAGAHLGGYGMTHRDARSILERSETIGDDWRQRVEELIYPYPGEFYLLPQASDGLSDADGAYQVGGAEQTLDPAQKIFLAVNRFAVAEDAPVAHFMKDHLAAEKTAVSTGDEGGFWDRLLGPARLFKSHYLGCVECGDCIQDHLLYSGCTMSRCYKELRNGPCGGSRVDGSCEMKADQPCVWARAYQKMLGAGQDPRKFARTLIPPRNWALNRTNSLANRYKGCDNYTRRISLEPEVSAANQDEEVSNVPYR